jgi:hypothetical protein
MAGKLTDDVRRLYERSEWVRNPEYYDYVRDVLRPSNRFLIIGVILGLAGIVLLIL